MRKNSFSFVKRVGYEIIKKQDMEAKKTPKADLENKRGAFLELGLVIAMLIIVGLFSISQSEKKVDMMASGGEIIEQEVIDVTVQEDKPVDVKPVETAAISDIIKIVKDDAKIKQEFTFLEDFDADALSNLEVKTFAKKEEAVDEEVPVFSAEEMPMFQGKDINEFRNWVGKNLVYPQLAAENGIQGRVTISFVVERDGKVSNVEIMRSVDRELDAAAVKTVSSSPKWTPGKNRGKPVRIKYIIPVDFTLQ